MVRAVLEGAGLFQFGLFLIVSGVSTCMSDTPKDRNTRNRNSANPPSDEAALSARLNGLDQRLSAIRNDRKIEAERSGRENEASAGRASGMAIGFRLSSELVAGVLVGAVIGWTFDHFLSTSPFGLIVFLLLGFVAGVVNVMRAAGVLAKQNDRL